MAMFEIPPALDEFPAFTQETVLDGTTYRFTFRWNVREQTWYLDIADTDDSVIVAGLHLVEGADLLRYVTDSRVPPGILFFVGVATETNLGKDALLYYADEDEVASL